MADGIRQKQGVSYKKQKIRALRHFAVVHENEPVPPILTRRRKDAKTQLTPATWRPCIFE
jgi:hypothetical protein